MKGPRATETFPRWGGVALGVASCIASVFLFAPPAAAQALGGAYVEHVVPVREVPRDETVEPDGLHAATRSPPPGGEAAKVSSTAAANGVERPDREFPREGPFHNSTAGDATIADTEPSRRAEWARAIFLPVGAPGSRTATSSEDSASVVFDLRSAHASVFSIDASGAWTEVLRIPFSVRGKSAPWGDEGLYVPVAFEGSARRKRLRRGFAAAESVGKNLRAWSVDVPEEAKAGRARRGARRSKGSRLSGAIVLASDSSGQGRFVFSPSDFARLSTLVRPSHSPLLVATSLDSAARSALPAVPFVASGAEDRNDARDATGSRSEALSLELEEWRSAWETADAPNYARFYAEGFRSLGRDREAWLDHKRETARIEGGNRSVRFGTPRAIRWKGATYVTFIQGYEAGRRRDHGLKSLRLDENPTGRIAIVAEHWRPLRSAARIAAALAPAPER